jgi:hypothetical protein
MVVLSSAEYRAHFIGDMYHRLLGRNVETLAKSQWVEVMGSGVTDEQVMSVLIGSPEYFSKAGGTDDLFLDRMYHDLLGRPIDEVGRASLMGALSSNDGQAQAALTVLRSDEYRSDLVRADYLRLVKTRSCRVLGGDSGTSGLIATIPGGWVTLIVGLALMGSAGLIARRVLRPRAGDDDVERRQRSRRPAACGARTPRRHADAPACLCLRGSG